MNAKAAINKEIFTPHNEKMLAAVQVKRRTKKKIPFLATGGQGDYMTFICLSVFIILAACSTVSPHSKKVLGSIPRWSGPGPFCVEVACSPCVCVGFLRELRFPLTIQRHAMTVKKPTQVSITKVKQFEGSSAFVRRSQWTLDQLRQVNGIDPNRDCPEFDLTFENGFDQWVAGSAGDKCVFVQVLHNTCQRYSADRKPEFVNCQSKLLGVVEDESVKSVVFRYKSLLNRLRKRVVSDPGVLLRTGNSILHSAADSVSSAVQKASQALNERGERLGRAEEKTGDMMNSAQQFADTAHKLAMKHKC
ncbi:syntaxin-binding protein 6 isoform X1 [Trichomycterus rosablanca]|uniref:syntaxin-binding protein 6 isoform X1 n=1 Tax=Trichomycterus rosablanca TaxID=2290929 RepID=UPI002F35B093